MAAVSSNSGTGGLDNSELANNGLREAVRAKGPGIEEEGGTVDASVAKQAFEVLQNWKSYGELGVGNASPEDGKLMLEHMGELMNRDVRLLCDYQSGISGKEQSPSLHQTSTFISLSETADLSVLEKIKPMDSAIQSLQEALVKFLKEDTQENRVALHEATQKCNSALGSLNEVANRIGEVAIPKLGRRPSEEDRKCLIDTTSGTSFTLTLPQSGVGEVSGSMLIGLAYDAEEPGKGMEWRLVNERGENIGSRANLGNLDTVRRQALRGGIRLEKRAIERGGAGAAAGGAPVAAAGGGGGGSAGPVRREGAAGGARAPARSKERSAELSAIQRSLQGRLLSKDERDNLQKPISKNLPPIEKMLVPEFRTVLGEWGPIPGCHRGASGTNITTLVRLGSGATYYPANRIKLGSGEYIQAEAPKDDKPRSQEHYYQMVIESGSELLVTTSIGFWRRPPNSIVPDPTTMHMLCPRGPSLKVGDKTITCSAERLVPLPEHLRGYAISNVKDTMPCNLHIRTLVVEKSGQPPRQITQIVPDFIPVAYPFELSQWMVDTVAEIAATEHRDTQAHPVIVNCNTGRDRSGQFIVLDSVRKDVATLREAGEPPTLSNVADLLHTRAYELASQSAEGAAIESLEKTLLPKFFGDETRLQPETGELLDPSFVNWPAEDQRRVKEQIEAAVRRHYEV